MILYGFMVRRKEHSMSEALSNASFKAYQSAMLTTPVLFFRIFGSLVGFASFLNSLLTWTLVLLQLYMA